MLAAEPLDFRSKVLANSGGLRTFPLSAHVGSATREINACVVAGGDLFQVPEARAALASATERGVKVRVLLPWPQSSWLGALAIDAGVAPPHYSQHIRVAANTIASAFPSIELRWYDTPGPCWFVLIDGTTLFTKPFDISRPTFPAEETRPQQLEHFNHLFDQVWNSSIAEPLMHWPKANAEPLVRVVSITPELIEFLASDPQRMRELTPEVFELLVAERLQAMGFWIHRTGHSNAPDGGIDLVASPEKNAAFPYLLAVQVKHSRRQTAHVRPAVIRELQSAMVAARLDVGLVVTNTRFSAPARAAAETAGLGRIRLRDMHDLSRWLIKDFAPDVQRPDLPEEILIAPGLRIKIPRHES